MMINRLRYNDENFKDKIRKLAYIYTVEFDSDTVLEFLVEGTLRAEGAEERKEQGKDWIVDIPNILYGEDDITLPTTVTLNNDGEEIEIPFPESIEEFRSMCKAHGITVRLNTKTAVGLYG